MEHGKEETKMNELFGYKKLIAWQVADELAHLVYDLTMGFPKEEIYGLISQLRRAALPIPTNIVEGHSRNSKKEFHHFLSITLGSLAETEYLMEYAYKRGFIKKESYEEFELLRNRTGQLVWKLFLSQK